jgi:ABC-2 type transport system permease protein
MHKVWAVIRREFLERVRTKQFVIGTVLGPVLMALLFAAPLLLMRDARAKRIVVLDAAAGSFGATVERALAQSTRDEEPDGEPRYLVTRVAADGRLGAIRDSLVALTDRPDLGEAGVDGIVVVTDEALARDTLQYLGANVGSPGEMGALARTLRQAVIQERLTRSGIDPALVLNTVRPIEVATAKVSQGRLTGQSGEASFALAYVMAFVLYMALLLYGVQVMTSTVEEKTNRINEVLVSSLKPWELLLGKVVGVGSVGLLQLGIWATTAYVLASQRVAIAEALGGSAASVASMPIPNIPAGTLVVLVIFFVLGFFFYSAAYAAVGSTCNTMQETQQASLPVTLMIAAGLMTMFMLLDEPNGQLARVLSLIPPLAPFVTPVRNSLSPVPLGELALSIALTGLGVLAMAWLAGRIYRVGILMYGKRASVREILRWIRA